MITTVTMNAALDKAYFMENTIVNGTVMRVARCHTTAGGKGLNVARAIAIYGADVQATGLVGGFNGQYLEPGFEVSSEEEQAFMDKFPEIIKESDVITISGSLPRGISKDIYGKMIVIAKAAGKKVLLDSSGETLKNAIAAGPTLVKPNQDERK